MENNNGKGAPPSGPYEKLSFSSSENFEREKETQLKAEASLVCPTCAGDTLLRSVGIQKCIRCKENFCLHNASRTDPRYYCSNCLKDLELKVDDDFIVEREVYSWKTDSTRIESRRCTTYELRGDAWLFAQLVFQTLTDAEQEVAIEYHRQSLSSLLLDQDMRRMEKLHRLAEKKQPASPLNLGATPQSSTHTRVQKTTTTKTKAAPAALDPALLQAAFKAGLTPEDILKMLAKGAGGK